MQAAARKFDVVVLGASGFTGRLVCEHIAKDYQVIMCSDRDEAVGRPARTASARAARYHIAVTHSPPRRCVGQGAMGDGRQGPCQAGAD